MFSKEECAMMQERMRGTMIEALGIRFVPSDDDTAICEMPICPATRQYFGILHGGASLALAETVAGAGSLHVIGFDPSFAVCGTEVSGTHVAMSAPDGKVYGIATPIHLGRTTHVWNVEIKGEDGKVISAERVTNRIIQK